MQESSLLRDAFAGILRDEGFFDLPKTQSKPVCPPPHIQDMLRGTIEAARIAKTVKLFQCEPSGVSAWGCLELTPNANGVFIQWYTNIDGVVQAETPEDPNNVASLP